MVIKLNSMQPTIWMPSTTDFVLTSGDNPTQIVSTDFLISGSAKYQNNTSAPWSKIALNLNTMFAKSGKTRFMINTNCYSWCKGYANTGSGSSYIRLSDGTTHLNLTEASVTVNSGGYYRSNYVTAAYQIEKISANQIKTTRVNYDLFEDGNGYTGTATASATTTTTFNNFTSLNLELYSAVGGSYNNGSYAAYYRAFSSFPKFVTRFS